MSHPTIRHRRALAAALLGPLLLAGCSLPQRAETESRPDGATPSASATASPGSGRAPVPGIPGAAPAPAPGRNPAAGARPDGPRVLDVEQRHPNGSVLRVTSLAVEANAIRLGIEVVNGADRDLGLSTGGAVVSLTDDLGGSYEFLEPTDNPDLQIPQRGTLSGELVYFGVLDPDAESLRLQTNATLYDRPGTLYDPASELPNEPFPHFSIEIPLGR